MPKRSARFWLIDLPAKIVDGWFRLYWFLVTVLAVACFVSVLLTLALAQFGIRWGW